MLILLLFYPQTLTLILSLPINTSSYTLYNYITLPRNTPPPHPQLLQDVIRTIAFSEDWSVNDIRVLDTSKIRYGKLNKYEVNVGKGLLSFRFEDEVDVWKKDKKGGSREGYFGYLVDGVGQKLAAMDSFKMEGLFELWLVEMMSLNSSYRYV